MEALKILESLMDSGAVNNSVAIEVLKKLHGEGVINLTKQLHEQCMAELRTVMSRDVVDSVVSKLAVIRELLPEKSDEEVMAIIDDNDSMTASEILGGE